MQWEGEAFCLSSKSVIERAFSLEEFVYEKIRGGILVGDCLLPKDIVSLIETNRICAVIVRKGSLADHTAVLLNGKGIQLAVAPTLPEIDSGTPILIEGERERLFIDETIEALQTYQNSHQKLDIDIQNDKLLSKSLSYFGDNVSVHVDGKTADELTFGLQHGAKGVGILRTEWLKWNDEKCPDEKIHFVIYKECAEKVHPHRLNIRLFDLGGDKIPNWAVSSTESLQSPLGARGIRALKLLPQTFENQLRGICKLACKIDLGIIIPMVTDVNDIKELKRMLFKIASPNARIHISIGAMIEIPAAAIKVKDILREVDFVRIGPGDLTQFCLAKLRSDLSPLELSGSSIHPAVLALIERITKECHNMNKGVSICLDVEPRIPLLQELLRTGIRIFCVSPQNVKITKMRLQKIAEESI